MTMASTGSELYCVTLTVTYVTNCNDMCRKAEIETNLTISGLPFKVLLLHIIPKEGFRLALRVAVVEVHEYKNIIYASFLLLLSTAN